MSRKRREATWRAISNRPPGRELARQVGLAEMKLKRQAQAVELKAQLASLQART